MLVQEKKIIKDFQIKIGLIVDQPKSGGSGTSNDGNSAHRFFDNAGLSSEITGTNVELISRFSTILGALSNGHHINLEAFEKYTIDSRKLYLKHYSWYYMPVTVHKILIHSVEVIKHALLPIGMLSDEAIKARHKQIRKYREGHARKMSHESNIQEVLNFLLVSFDPVIFVLTPFRQKKKDIATWRLSAVKRTGCVLHLKT